MCQLETAWMGTSQDLQWNLESRNIITKGGKDLQDHWVWAPKSLSPTAKTSQETHRTSTENSPKHCKHFPPLPRLEFPRGEHPHSITNTHKVLWPFLPVSEMWGFLLLWLWAAAPGSGYGAWKGRMGAQGKEWRQGKIIEGTSALVMLHISHIISINKLSVRRCSC